MSNRTPSLQSLSEFTVGKRFNEGGSAGDSVENVRGDERRESYVTFEEWNRKAREGSFAKWWCDVRNVLLNRLARSLLAGTMLIMALTSLASFASALRWGRAAEPCIWISNPLGTTQTPSVVWNLVLFGVFGLTAAMVLTSNSERRWLSASLAMLLSIAVVLAGADAIVFARLLRSEQIQSSWPMPLSLVVAGLCGFAAWLVLPRRNVLKPPATPTSKLSSLVTAAVTVVGLLAGQVLMVWLHVESFGATDYRREADVAVVLGARVYPNGSLSLVLEDRLKTAVELFDSQLVKRILVTGATGVERINEATAMRDFLVAQQIPTECILIDDRGINTLASARNVRRLMSERGLQTALIVSHDFHLARCKLLFEEQGIRCVTVPARETRRLIAESYFTVRECVGYLWYALTRPLRDAPPSQSVPKPDR